MLKLIRLLLALVALLIIVAFAVANREAVTVTAGALCRRPAAVRDLPDRARRRGDPGGLAYMLSRHGHRVEHRWPRRRVADLEYQDRMRRERDEAAEAERARPGRHAASGGIALTPCCALLDAIDAVAAAPYPALIEALRQGFGPAASCRSGIIMPCRARARSHLAADAGLAGGRWPRASSSCISPPATRRSACRPSRVSICCSTAPTGTPEAVLDGTALTARRTAATSALAADYLARSDAARLLVVGAGAMAPHLAWAHAAVRLIRRIEIWNRTPARAAAVAAGLPAKGWRPAAAAPTSRRRSGPRTSSAAAR